MLRFVPWLILLGLLVAGCAASPTIDDPSRVRFSFADWEGPALRVFAVEPETAGPQSPVIFVLHGVNRNADDYRDNWVDLATTYGFRVYVPEFSDRLFPGAENYNLGGLGGDGPFAFDAIEALYAHLRTNRSADPRGYVIFGHSAGAQFVHRFTCFGDTSNLRLAIAANAGWYTRPDPEHTWPYSLSGAPKPLCRLEDWFAQPLLVMLGDGDTDPNNVYLRRTPEAMAQGAHRLERGLNFLTAARELARQSDIPIAWRFEIVEGVGHDNRGMALAAARMISEMESAPALSGSRQD